MLPESNALPTNPFRDLPDRRRLPTTLSVALLIVVSVVLFGSSVYRALNFPFTHDESLSFAIFNYQPVWADTANNHVLNTYLMQFFSGLFGVSELTLRLASILAHLLYLVSSVLLLLRVRSWVLRLAGFVLLNFNPFMLDFFFVARGYGLALAFLLLSVFLLTLAYEKKTRPAQEERARQQQSGTQQAPAPQGKKKRAKAQPPRAQQPRESPRREKQEYVRYLIFSVLAAAFSVLANFAFLNYFLPLLAVCAWFLFTDGTFRRLRWTQSVPALALFGVSAFFLMWVLGRTFDLQARGELYFGGKAGFLADTVLSLVSGWRYNVAYAEPTDNLIVGLAVLLFIGLVGFGAYIFFLRKQTPLFMVYLVLLVCAVALPLVQNLVIGTLFPVERAALYYLPLFGLAVIFAFEDWGRNSAVQWQTVAAPLLPALFALALVFHLFRSYQPLTLYNWGYDGHNDKALEIIEQDRQTAMPERSVRLGISWMFEPSMNFYRFTRQYRWLAPVTRAGINPRDYDYIYALESDVAQTPIPNAVQLASFPDTKTVLLRVNRSQAP